MAAKCLSDKHFNHFRAPPPSPVASSFTNEDVLSDFLQHSLRVPDLILPDKIFPKLKIIQPPIEIDFNSLSCDKIVDSIAKVGCFQLVNHGISRDVIRSACTCAAAAAAAAGVFKVLPEKGSGFAGRVYGFEEVPGDDGGEIVQEEFVWCRDDNFNFEMEGIMPFPYSIFSEKMESISKDFQEVGRRIVCILTKNSPEILMSGHEKLTPPMDSTVCYIHKHNSCHHIDEDSWVKSLKYDVIRMLIRGSDHKYALCFHICNGASEFHIYSKRGWVSFCPDVDALIVTIGDQVEAGSNGLYKQVIGRPIFKGENQEDCISMAFLYSSPNSIIYNKIPDAGKTEKTISIVQQTIFAIFSTMFYQLLLYVYNKF